MLLLSLSLSHYSSNAADFCVADLEIGFQTPSGFPCKNPSFVTASDFKYSGLVTGGNTTNINKVSIIRAFVQQFPGLNGLGMGAGRLDIEPGGAISAHTHWYASEMIYVVEGTVTAGFVSGVATNTVYLNKLSKGEIMIFPQGLVHFQVNTGTETAVVLATYGSEDPGTQIISPALFGNNLPSLLVEKATNIDEAEVKKLKVLLGGSG
ncbi:unnamed protein product [Linum tenue]|uniref:Germin-like protein n=2 Tax=Linum tenue TaxID=586396 RepID=A0AAV0KBH3_9ROSI|nr:unnamed protein product [Linum tenue]